MRALVLKAPKTLAVMDVPEMKPGPGQVILRVSKCGICGSDIRYYCGENPWAKQTLGKEIPNPPNIILGHEFVGVVDEVCDRQDAELLGQRVGVNTFITCGRCSFCKSGRENLCPNTRHLGHGQGWGKMDFYPGGMAERCLAFSSQVYELPEHVTDEQATFLDPMIAALHAVEVGGPKVLDKVAICGAGPIGLLIAQFAKIYGAVQTFITDVADENIAVARAVGVDFPLKLSPGEKGPGSPLAEFCEWEPHQTQRDAFGSPSHFRELVMDQTRGAGVDLVFDTVGTTQTIQESLGLLKKGGTLVLMATKEEDIRFPALLLSAERTIKTSSNALYTDFPRAIECLATGKIRVDPLITHRFALTQALEAFQTACNKSRTGAIKIVLDCQS
jgi:threonine dehydrogenase-like Zn-dependent dehydrogenase